MTEPASAIALEALLREERTRVDAALATLLDEVVAGLPEILREPVRHGVLLGGKRVRPILCILAYRALRGDSDPGAPLSALAASIELIHAYSLMHDDLPCMDDAPLRRGRPTPHTLFGERVTMLAGAALIPAAIRTAWRAAGSLGLPPDDRGEAAGLLARAAGAGGMVGGQMLDLLAEGVRLDETQLEAIHRRKTGALLTASLEIGAVAGGATPEERGALRSYGQAVGLAFQVSDDLLDLTQGVEVLGKEPSDEALDKSTYPSLLGVEGARGRARLLVEEARSALAAAGIASSALDGIAEYVVMRSS